MLLREIKPLYEERRFWVRLLTWLNLRSTYDPVLAVTVAADVTLRRVDSTDQGTFGELTTTTGFTCKTLELPDRGNKQNISCIPKGVYECIPITSKRFGKTFLLKNVDGRSEILFHWGNWAGDKSKGYRSDSLGCILLGRKRAHIGKQKAITHSKFTMSDFLVDRKNKPFTLEIL